MLVRDETLWRRWSRRALTLSSCYLVFAVSLIASPLWIPLSLIIGLFRGNSFSETRALLFVSHYAFCQVWASVGLLLIWLFSGAWLGIGQERMVDWTWRIEYLWVKAFGAGTLRIWNIRPNFEFDYEFTDRPVILFVRHASIADTFIPLLYVSVPFDLRLRLVLKRELEWDPCIDIAINRMQQLFVRRGSGDSEKEVLAIGKLIEDVGPREGIIIFPEGTRYSEAKKARILDKLEEAGETEILEHAQKYQRVLPPRMAGPLALLESNPGADAVFCAHTGLEKSSSFRESFNGGLVNTKVHIRFWGVPFEDIPTDAAARQTWLLEEWKKVDDFIVEHSDSEEA